MRFRFLGNHGWMLPFAALAFCTALAAAPAPKLQAAQQAPPDNTKQNKDKTAPTADQQSMSPADQAITQKIRKSIHDDDTLSTYAHNVKIITQNGKVTLRGPVKSEDEKANILAKAVAIAGADNVTNELEVAPTSN